MAVLNNSTKKRRTVVLWAGAVIAGACAFSAGWIAAKNSSTFTLPSALRLGGYHYISPLLSCNLTSSKLFPQKSAAVNAIQSVIQSHENSGDITKASVYFSDFKGGAWANVNGSEQYYPSSLGKVPIMMAFYAMSENSSTLFDKKITYPVGSPDLNAQQEIQPSQALAAGQTYTVGEAVDDMIKYSDNNAADLLANVAGTDNLNAIYNDLQIPIDNSVTSSTLDFMTPQQYSILFRTLYNATYLTREDSEAALKLMAQTSFTQGLVAGVPSGTTVAHKFGIVSFYNGPMVTDRELHDCGIVYAPSHPYLLCVMTRGASSLQSMEGTIADISRAVYAKVENGYQ